MRVALSAQRGPQETVTPSNGLCFEYQPLNVQAVLQGVSLQLDRGKVLALTGPSGEGKSTLASLVTRLYEPRRGYITLDGVDIATLNPSWLRRQVWIDAKF